MKQTRYESALEVVLCPTSSLFAKLSYLIADYTVILSIKTADLLISDQLSATRLSKTMYL